MEDVELTGRGFLFLEGALAVGEATIEMRHNVYPMVESLHLRRASASGR